MVRKFGTIFHPIRKIVLKPNSKSFTKIGLCLFTEICSSYSYPNPCLDPFGNFFSPNLFCLQIKTIYIQDHLYTQFFHHPVFFCWYNFEFRLEFLRNYCRHFPLRCSFTSNMLFLRALKFKFLRTNLKVPFDSFINFSLLVSFENSRQIKPWNKSFFFTFTLAFMFFWRFPVPSSYSFVLSVFTETAGGGSFSFFFFSFFSLLLVFFLGGRGYPFWSVWLGWIGGGRSHWGGGLGARS